MELLCPRVQILAGPTPESLMAHASHALRASADSEFAIAKAYNEAGYRYGKYADGPSRGLFQFEGRHAYSDRKAWEAIEGRLLKLRAGGVDQIRVLDIGCGPGIWLRRVVVRARQIGFSRITALGIDIADTQISRARAMSRGAATLEGVTLNFSHGDLRGSLPDGRFDLVLCLYGILNHIPAPEQPEVFARLAAATGGWLVCAVRTVGSTPTVYVDDVCAALRFYQDNRIDQLDVEFANGRKARFPSHLFSRAELQRLAAPRFEIDDLRGLDLFHGRFDSDPRWNPHVMPPARLAQELERLEDRYCRDPGFIDRATHLLLTAHRAKIAS
jgi:SAM-dependent methyltransferase